MGSFFEDLYAGFPGDSFQNFLAVGVVLPWSSAVVSQPAESSESTAVSSLIRKKWSYEALRSR
jgi:hypothetical protein